MFPALNRIIHKCCGWVIKEEVILIKLEIALLLAEKFVDVEQPVPLTSLSRQSPLVINILYFIFLQFPAVASEISFSFDVKYCRRVLVPRKPLVSK